MLFLLLLMLDQLLIGNFLFDVYTTDQIPTWDVWDVLWLFCQKSELPYEIWLESLLHNVLKWGSFGPLNSCNWLIFEFRSRKSGIWNLLFGTHSCFEVWTGCRLSLIIISVLIVFSELPFLARRGFSDSSESDPSYSYLVDCLSNLTIYHFQT